MDVRPETINPVEENIGCKLPDIGLGNNLLDLTPKGNKSKNQQVGLHQTPKLLYSKGSYQQNEKATYWIGENICKSHTWKGVNIQSI